MGHVNVPDGLKEIIQQNNEKAYPQIIMEQASYPYLFHLSDIRENLIAFLPVTKQMHVLERNAGCGALTGKLLSMALHVTAVVESEEEADILRVRYENGGTIGSELGVTLGASKSYSLGSGYSVTVPKGSHYLIKYRPMYYTYKVVETKYKERYNEALGGMERYVVETKTCYVDVFSHWDFTHVAK